MQVSDSSQKNITFASFLEAWNSHIPRVAFMENKQETAEEFAHIGGKMASASVLQRLTQRAKQAEEIIVALKSQIEIVKQAAAISASKGEEEKLREENRALLGQIESLKVRLTLAEIKNGVKQVQLPVKKKKTEDGEKKAEVIDTPKPAVEKDAGKAVTKGDTDKKKVNKGQKGGDDKPTDAPKPAKSKGGKKGGEAEPERDIDISRLDLRVGKIVDVTRHPDAEKLYMETVDLGEGKTRTILSGLVENVPIEEMQNRIAVFMCNLKPAKMRGIMSEGMIMCASSPEKVEILVPPPGSEIGDRVTCKKYPGTPDALLNPKKKIWETIKPDLLTNAEKVACYKGSPLEIEGKGFLVAPTLPNTQIS